MIRPVDTEELEDICRDIALQNYGFLYVNEHKGEIQSEYESADKGVTKAGTVSASDLKESLREIANDDFSEFQRLRNGVYFYDPLGLPEGKSVSDDLSSVFRSHLVIDKQTFESVFDIAPKDVDFLANHLEQHAYLERITTGKRDYYVSGTKLKENTSRDTSVSARLSGEASGGTVSQSDLEDVIDVAATDDVIRYLEDQDFILDIGEEYIVQSEMDAYARHLIGEIGDSVEDEIGTSGLLPLPEFEQVIRNEINDRFDVLSHLGRGEAAELLETVQEALAETYGLEVDRDVVVDRAAFDEYVDQRARDLREEVESEHDLATPSDYREVGHPRIDDMEVSDATAVNRYVRDGLEDRFDELVDERFSAGTDN